MNRVIEHLGSKYPIMQAPMGWIARSKLASAVSNAGGFGILETSSGEVLMPGYMNAESLTKTIETKEAYYWSRSREVLWKKGHSSGMIHEVDEILIDDDQDSLLLKVTIKGLGASCHVGYKSCFYRSLQNVTEDGVKLEFTEDEKVFDPEIVYPGAENPTKL